MFLGNMDVPKFWKIYCYKLFPFGSLSDNQLELVFDKNKFLLGPKHTVYGWKRKMSLQYCLPEN